MADRVESGGSRRRSSVQSRQDSPVQSRQDSPDDWGRSPYTRFHSSRNASPISRELSSPIFIVVEESPDIKEEERHSQDIPPQDAVSLHQIENTEQNENEKELNQKENTGQNEDEKEVEFPTVPISYPPVGHMGDFFQKFPWTSLKEEDDDSSEDDDDLMLVESNTFRDDRTFFGTQFSSITIAQTQSLFFEDNKEQMSNAANVVDNVTQTPLSEFWHTFTQIFFNLVFFTNVVVAFVDVGLYPVYLTYKIPTLILGILENIILFLMWAYIKARKKEEDQQSSKHQQYVENIVHEMLLYPSIIVSVLGVASDKMYSGSTSGAFGWVQIGLLCIDVMDLIWTQIVRLYMIYKFVKDLQRALMPDESQSCCNFNFAGRLLPRLYFTAVGNHLLFLLLIFIMFAQMNNDNLKTSNYRMTFSSMVIAISLMVLPILSLILFFAANGFWVMEFLISVNLKIATDTEFQKSLEDDYGAVMSDSLSFAMNKAKRKTAQRQLEDIRQIPAMKKLFYGLSEVHVLGLLFLWEALVLLVLIMFDGFSSAGPLYSTKILFMIFSMVTNAQVLLLCIAMNTSTPFVFIGMLFYPISVYLCFDKIYGNDEEDDSDDEFDV